MMHAPMTVEPGESELSTAEANDDTVTPDVREGGVDLAEESASLPAQANLPSAPKMRRSRFRKRSAHAGAPPLAVSERPPIGRTAGLGYQTSRTAAQPIERSEVHGPKNEQQHVETPEVGAPPPASEGDARAVSEALGEAVERVTRLARDARAARQRDTATYEGPDVPREPVRRELLLEAARVTPRASEVRSNQLRQIDLGVSRIAGEIIANPLWIAADYLERHVKLENVELSVREDARIKEAERSYAQAEKALVAAKSDLERFEGGRASWARKLDKALPVRWRKHTRLHAQMEMASQKLVYGKVERGVTEANVRAELEVAIGERNNAALEKQREARKQRDEVERHLREALMHRHVGERIADPKGPPSHLKDAPAGRMLDYRGVSRLGPFAFQEFGAEGRTYLADALEVRETVEHLDLARGDRVVVQQGSFGELSLDVHSRGDVWSGARAITGKLVEIEREGDTVRGIKLHDTETNQAKWVRPREGTDLGKDLSPAVLRCLVPDDTIHIDGRSIYVRPGPGRAQDRGR